MVFSPDFEEIGYIEKTHGITGWLKVNLYQNSIPNLLGMEFLFLEQHGQKVPFKVKEIKTDGSLLQFDKFDTPETARAFVHSGIFMIASKQQIPAVQSLIGYQVEDHHGSLVGEIMSFIAIPNNPLIAVKMRDKEVSLPFSDTLVIQTNHKTKVITYQIPDGLLDL